MPLKAVFCPRRRENTRENGKLVLEAKEAKLRLFKKSFYKYGGNRGGEWKEDTQPLSPSGIGKVVII